MCQNESTGIEQGHTPVLALPRPAWWGQAVPEGVNMFGDRDRDLLPSAGANRTKRGLDVCATVEDHVH